jgi:hypothetical protein
LRLPRWSPRPGPTHARQDLHAHHGRRRHHHALEKLPSISLNQTIATDLRVQQAILKAVPEVKAIVARSGSDELGWTRWA